MADSTKEILELQVLLHFCKTHFLDKIGEDNGFFSWLQELSDV